MSILNDFPTYAHFDVGRATAEQLQVQSHLFNCIRSVSKLHFIPAESCTAANSISLCPIECVGFVGIQIPNGKK